MLWKDGRSNQPVQGTRPVDSNSFQSADNTTSSTTSQLTGSDQLPDRITDLNIPFHRFYQKEAITSWVRELDQDQILSWLEQSVEVDWDVSKFVRTEFQKKLIQKLSQNDPSLALKFALERHEPMRSTLGSVVFFEWAIRDLSGAIEKAKTLESLDRYWILHSIFQSQDSITHERQREISIELGDEEYYLEFYFQSILANESDAPRDLWYEVVELVTWENVEHFDVFEEIASAYVSEAGLEVFGEVITSITDEDIRGALAIDVMRAFIDTAERSAEAFEYLLSLEEQFPRREVILEQIIRNWARLDPISVLRRSETLLPSGFRDRMLSHGYSQRARSEPEHALENLAEIPPKYRTNSAKAAISALTETAPSEATNFVLQMIEDELQQQLAITLVNSWSNHDLTATMNWVLSLASDEPLRDILLKPLADSVFDTDPQLAFEIASQQSLKQWGWKMRGYEVDILRQIARSDIESALELLAQVREETKFAAYVQIARELIIDGDSQRAAHLARDLSESEQLEYFVQVVGHWTEEDMHGLMNSIDQIDLPEARSWTVMFMMQMNEHSKELNDEEIQSLHQHLTEAHKELVENDQIPIHISF